MYLNNFINFDSKSKKKTLLECAFYKHLCQYFTAVLKPKQRVLSPCRNSNLWSSNGLKNAQKTIQYLDRFNETVPLHSQEQRKISRISFFISFLHRFSDLKMLPQEKKKRTQSRSSIVWLTFQNVTFSFWLNFWYSQWTWGSYDFL